MIPNFVRPHHAGHAPQSAALRRSLTAAGRISRWLCIRIHLPRHLRARRPNPWWPRCQMGEGCHGSDMTAARPDRGKPVAAARFQRFTAWICIPPPRGFCALHNAPAKVVEDKIASRLPAMNTYAAQANIDLTTTTIVLRRFDRPRSYSDQAGASRHLQSHAINPMFQYGRGTC